MSATDKLGATLLRAPTRALDSVRFGKYYFYFSMIRGTLQAVIP